MNEIRPGGINNPNELYHHGVKGMKWGVRRYQNPDGSLTDAGFRKQFGSKRSLRKRIDQMQRQGTNTNQKAVKSAASKQLEDSKEGRAYKAANLLMIQTARDISKQTGVPINKIQLSDPSGTIQRVNQNFERKGKEIAKATFNDYAGATLKDLGFEDTQAGRDYLIRKGVIHL